MRRAAAQTPEKSAAKAWLRALEMTARIEATPERIFPEIVQELGARFGETPALLAQEEVLSHAGLAARANRYARWALKQNIAKGERVCLLMRNRPDYLAIWLGLSHIGAVVALLNTNLSGDALGHAIEAAAPGHIIADDRLHAALDGIKTEAKIWRHDEEFAALIGAFPGERLCAGEKRRVVLNDPALLIYTSGTTGMPKAAFVSHHRVMMWTHWFAGMMDASAQDRLYNCLPMYHSVGGVVACGAPLLKGGSVVIREKFSASRFWSDIAESGATIFQYIGELCRYLLTAAEEPPPNRLRLACGNGLSADIWEAFQNRFHVPRILEFYAATEANFSLFNAEGKPGAIGRVPGFLRHRFGVALVKTDPDGEARRGADGFCRRVAIGEAGEAIGRIEAGTARFEGYSDAGATEKKVLRHVFEKGDAWFRTGDLMRQDAQGFYYFVDRLGDTFRWKGENVATAEVAAALMACPGVKAACVFGVAVPGSEGKAGMAALETAPDFDLSRLSAHLASLPSYARPIFLRLVPSLLATETFKPRKTELAMEGCDPSRVPDPLYVRTGQDFEKMDPALYRQIREGQLRF